MRVITAAALVLIASGAAAAPQAPAFSEVVRAIQVADYKGERAHLHRLAAILERDGDPKLAAYRHYWRGFALWRRAVNGLNETPQPGDLEADLNAGVASFEKALALQPDWIEARIGIMGCAGPLLFLAKDDAPRREAVLKAYVPVARGVGEQGKHNPRALWLQGQAQLGAPPPIGGQPERAAATFQRGIEAAIAEARRAPAGEPVWIPVCGGAENLMNLAYLYTHSALANRELALAYAQGALVAAPDWHYVRDILWPKILELARPSAPGAARPSSR